MRARRMGFGFMSHDCHDIRIGTLGVEVIGQTRTHGLGEQMAEQQDAAAAHADLEESGAFALYPDDIVTNGRNHPPSRPGQPRVGTDMQDGAAAGFHEALMSQDTLALIAFSAYRMGGPCILLAVS